MPGFATGTGKDNAKEDPYFQSLTNVEKAPDLMGESLKQNV